MTIKKIEQQVGIPRANIRFYESEGLLTPGRKANNYREYTADDIESLKKIKCLRALGVSVPDIRMMIHGEVSMEMLLDKRIQEIKTKKEELLTVQTVCRELKEQHTAYENLELSTLDVKMELLKVRERQMTNQDKKDNWGTLRRAAMAWCMLCIVSMVVIPIHAILRIEVPATVQNTYILVVMLSPLPYYLINMVAKKNIGDDSGLYLPKKKSILTSIPDPKSWDKLESFHQLCIVPLAVIPLNRIFHIQWPDWLTMIWILTIAISTLLLLTKRNRNS